MIISLQLKVEDSKAANALKVLADALDKLKGNTIVLNIGPVEEKDKK